MKKLTVLVALFISFSSASANLNLTYDSFYRHLKKVNKDEMEQLTMAFGFTRQGLSEICQLEEVEIHTPKVDLPVAIDQQNRFELPIERALKQAKADVNIEFQSQSIENCFVSIQLRVKSQLYRKNIPADDLKSYLRQFDEFFSNAGSFFSFLLPKPTGLVIQFSSNEKLLNAVNQFDKEGVIKEDGQVFLSRDWLSKNQDVLAFTEQPMAIFARMPNN